MSALTNAWPNRLLICTAFMGCSQHPVYDFYLTEGLAALMPCSFSGRRRRLELLPGLPRAGLAPSALAGSRSAARSERSGRASSVLGYRAHGGAFSAPPSLLRTSAQTRSGLGKVKVRRGGLYFYCAGAIFSVSRAPATV